VPEVQPSIFVSYAHEDVALAHAFAPALEAAGARVWLDQGELLIGDSLIERISEAIAEFDFVAALVSAASVKSNWCRKEIALAMSKQLTRGARQVTVLPVRVGDVQMPPSLADVLWVPLDAESLHACAADVVRDAARHLTLRGRIVEAETQSSGGPAAATQDARSVTSDDSAVRILGVYTDGVSRARSDGSRGSALYSIPLRLNRVPHPSWTASFQEAWNHPPAWTTMHRPGIASVRGSQIVLEGTTIEELERFHLKTLRLVVHQLNLGLARHLEEERRHRVAAEEAGAAHDRSIREAAARLRFDDD